MFDRFAFAIAGAGLGCLMATSVAAQDANTDWSGFYAGVHGGYGWGTVDWDVGPGMPIVINPTGMMGGALAGYDAQINALVLGLETDITLAGVSAAPDDYSIGGLQSAKVNYSASLRGRLGIAAGPVMPFVTAGIGLASLNIEDSFGGVPNSNTEVLPGFVAGAGIQAALADIGSTGMMIGRVEYLHGWYPAKDFQIGATPEPAGLGTNTVRASLIVKFN